MAEHLSVTDMIAILRMKGEELILMHFGTMPERVERNLMVLETFLRHLASGEDSVGCFPITAERPVIRAVEAELAGKDRFLTPAYQRLCAFSWLFARLRHLGYVDGRGPIVSRQRYRDLAVRPTALAVTDANRLEGTLTPALVSYALDANPPLPIDELALAIVVLLIWEEALTIPRLFAVLRTFAWDHHVFDKGYVNLHAHISKQRQTEESTKPDQEDGHPVHDAPLRVYDSDLGQVLLNYYRSRSLCAGNLDWNKPDSLVFPFQTGVWDPARPGALARAVGDLARRLGQHPDPRFGYSRLIDAARTRALDRYPPAIVAVLSGKLRFAPVPDSEADPGSGKEAAEDPAPPAEGPQPSSLPVPVPTSSTENDEEEEEIGWSDLADISYQETLLGIRSLERKLNDPRKKTPRAALLAEAEALLQSVLADVQALGNEVPERLHDLVVLLEYLCWQLRHPHGTPQLYWKNSLGAIQARWCGLAAHVDACLGERGLRRLSDDEWIEFALDMMTLVRRAPSTQKRIRGMARSLHSYLAVYHNTPEWPIPQVNWSTPELAVALALCEYSFLRPWELDRADRRLSNVRDPQLARLLPQGARLTYGTSLRRVELCTLPIGGVVGGMEPLLDIRRSKTSNGLRFIPLRPLLPAVELESFWNFYREQAATCSGDPARLVFATPEEPAGPNMVRFADRIADALRRVTKKDISFHSLRHAFACLFLLRWFVATYGRKVAAFLGPLLDTPWFSDAALAEFRRLFSCAQVPADPAPPDRHLRRRK